MYNIYILSFLFIYFYFWYFESFGNSSINDITSGDVAAASNLLAARNRVTDLHVIGAYQTIMKLHPLFDVALAEVNFNLFNQHTYILLL